MKTRSISPELTNSRLLATTATAEQRWHSTARIEALVIRLIAVSQFSLFAYFLYRTAIFSPISDSFAYIDSFMRYRAGEMSLWAYLWRAHGEHHLLWIRLLTWADVEFVGTRGIPFMAAATAAISGTAALVWGQLVRALPKEAPTTSLALLAPMLVLSSPNVTDCSVPINTTYPLTVFFVTLAIVLFANDGKSPHPQARAAAAIPAAFAASFGTAAGLLAWPILAWLAWRQRRKAWFAVWAGLGVCYILFYAHDINPIGLAPAMEKDVVAFTSAAHLRKLFNYFFAFLGLPLTREPRLELIGGALGVALFLSGAAIVLIATLSERLNTRLDRIAVGMIMLGLAAAALASIGRSDMIEEVKVPVRYALFTTALHVGLLCIVLPRLAVRARILACWAAVVFAAALLVQQVFVGRAATRIAAGIAEEADCFAEGKPRLPISKILTPAPEGAIHVIAALRQQGLLAPRARDCAAPKAHSGGDASRPWRTSKTRLLQYLRPRVLMQG
jgi:hypothetical protein